MGRNAVKLDRDTHSYTANGKPVGLHVGKVLEEAGIVKPYKPEAMANVRNAADRGEVTHEWCDWLDGNPQDLAPLDDLIGSDIFEYVLGYEKFREIHTPVWDFIEQSFERGGCGGTVDRIGRITLGKEIVTAVVDIKTSREPADHWGLQLTAYHWLAQPLEALLFVVWLRPDGSFMLLNYDCDTDVWEAALKVAKWKMLHS